jgi:hypothetical protein
VRSVNVVHNVCEVAELRLRSLFAPGADVVEPFGEFGEFGAFVDPVLPRSAQRELLSQAHATLKVGQMLLVTSVQSGAKPLLTQPVAVQHDADLQSASALHKRISKGFGMGELVATGELAGPPGDGVPPTATDSQVPDDEQEHSYTGSFGSRVIAPHGKLAHCSDVGANRRLTHTNPVTQHVEDAQSDFALQPMNSCKLGSAVVGDWAAHSEATRSTATEAQAIRRDIAMQTDKTALGEGEVELRTQTRKTLDE